MPSARIFLDAISPEETGILFRQQWEKNATYFGVQWQSQIVFDR